MRVAVIGMGAIGHIVERALEGRCEIVRVDRTKAPLRDGEAAVDAAVVCVKTFGTAWAADIALRVLAPDGVVTTVQNGLGNYETLVQKVGRDRVSLGVIYVGATLRPDGTLAATGAGRVELGRPPAPTPAARLDALAALMREGGMTVTVVDDAWRSVWRKVIVNAAMNPTTALLGCTNGELVANESWSRIADGIAREVARVAGASGTDITDDDAVTVWRATATTLGANRSSMLHDMTARRRTEIAAINGAVAREAERFGIQAPLNAAITSLVAAAEAGLA